MEMESLLGGHQGAASERCLDRVAAHLGSPKHIAALLSACRALHGSQLPVLRAPAEWGAEGLRGTRAALAALTGRT